MNNHIVCFAALVVTILVASPAAARIECRGNSRSPNRAQFPRHIAKKGKSRG